MIESSRCVDLGQIAVIIGEAKKHAIQYRELTGKPLGITGEVAEYEAARILGLELCQARQAGYDAVRIESGSESKVQIKGRCIITKNPGQRVGSIRLDHLWDSVVLVLLDADFEPFAIHEADRQAVEAALLAPGSKARNDRGALSVGKFITIGRQVWPAVVEPD